MFSDQEIHDFIEEQTFSVVEETYQDSYGIVNTGDLYDEQEWLEHRLLSYPMSECGCMPEKTIVRKSGHLAYNWGPQDYAQMAHEEYTSPRSLEAEAVEKIDKPKQIISTGHTRVQVTFYKHSQYQKGNSGNFELKEDIDNVFKCLHPLTQQFPKQKKPDHYVRIQLQNKDKNIMKGGRNISVHNATVPVVMDILHNLFEDQGWLSPDQLPATDNPITKKDENIHREQKETYPAPHGAFGEREVLNNINISQKNNIFSTEDGSQKPVEVFSFQGHRGSTNCRIEKSEKDVQIQRDRRDARTIRAEQDVLRLIGIEI